MLLYGTAGCPGGEDSAMLKSSAKVAETESSREKSEVKKSKREERGQMI
jgi:hypothetical protein